MSKLVVLTRGTFSCTGDYAAEVAHMLSNAEACVCSGVDVADVCDVISDYLRGHKDASEAIDVFDRWFKEQNTAPVPEPVEPEPRT